MGRLCTSAELTDEKKRRGPKTTPLPQKWQRAESYLSAPLIDSAIPSVEVVAKVATGVRVVPLTV